MASTSCKQDKLTRVMGIDTKEITSSFAEALDNALKVFNKNVLNEN